MKPNMNLLTSTSSLSCTKQHTLERVKLALLKQNTRRKTETTTTSRTQKLKTHIILLINSTTHKPHLPQIHAHALRTSLLDDPAVSLPFLCRFVNSKDIVFARKVFYQIKKPTLYIYNTMLKGYCLGGFAEEGLRLFSHMRRVGVGVDAVSYSIVFKCLELRAGVQVHGRVLSNGWLSDCVLMTGLMEFYSGFGRVGDVIKVFEEMSCRDTVAWNVLLSCFLRNGRTRDVLVVFDDMENGRVGCEPDKGTCLLAVQACTSLGAVELGERVHGYIESRGYGDVENLCNSLVAMYSRCGCLDKAYEVFKGMPDKDVVSWSAMIHGLATNKYGRDALDAFEEMLRMGVRPDEQTFTGVLTACSRCNLVDEGMVVFDRMTKEFGIVPNIHHCGCMVDLLGRAGMLDQAYELIMSMRVKPDATIWRTLLRACKIHGHFVLGESVLGHLIELKGQEAGDFVLLQNMYLSAENWDKLESVKVLMKENGIQSMPGCSTIELKGVVHEFVADDVSFSRKDEIYNTLVEILQQLKIAGYSVDLPSGLQNSGAEEKGHVLSHHSEKLAIALGVLETPPGTKIRVAKNDRICNDCHNFAKLFSSVYNRYVIIVDCTRFHHFREGRCSCNDCW